jgi:hypothetical protein
MTVKQLVDQLDSLADSERERLIRPLMAMLSLIALETLMRFQEDWVAARRDEMPSDATELHGVYLDFVKEQNIAISACIDMEVSPLGVVARQLCNLEPLTYETEIVVDTPVGTR